ncbi:hypothetical protein GCM10017744_101960 [Streptomyces antimycoticus]
MVAPQVLHTIPWPTPALSCTKWPPLTSRHTATLREGPAVTGEWADDSTALRTYRGWVGLYGSDEHVVIRLILKEGANQHVLRTWAEQREVETPLPPGGITGPKS